MNCPNRAHSQVDQLLEGGVSTTRGHWQQLADRIRGSDPDAPGEWVNLQWRAAWLLLRRRLGAAATPELARAALAEAVLEVRSGTLDGPRHLVAWLSGFAARHETVSATRLSNHASPLALQISRLADALRNCDPRDRDALRRYYFDGQTPEQVAHDLGLTDDEFRKVRVRLRAVVSQTPRKPADTTGASKAPPLQRRVVS